MWVKAFRIGKGYYCNTNNGTEAQNRVLKYVFLKMCRTYTLARLLEIVIEDYIPASLSRYMKTNKK